MRRYISFLLVLMLMGAVIPAHASMVDVPQLSPMLFPCAKQALVFIASGEYESLVTLLPFSGLSPSAAEWQSFVEGNFLTLTPQVQTEYSVAYWIGTDWKLAIPLYTPDGTEGLEALVLTSVDGMTFSGYRYSLWSDVMLEYEMASYVTWNKEYIEGAPVIIAD